MKKVFNSILILILISSQTLSTETPETETVSLNKEPPKEDYNEEECLKASKEQRRTYFQMFFGKAPSKDIQTQRDNTFKKYCKGYENQPFVDTLAFIRTMSWLYGSKVTGQGKDCYDYFLVLKEKMAKKNNEEGTIPGEERVEDDDKEEIFKHCYEPTKRKKTWYPQLVYAIYNFL